MRNRIIPVFLLLMIGVTGCKRIGEGEKPEGDQGPRLSPGQVDEELVGHIKAGRYERAYALMTSAYRATVPLDDFTRAVRNNRYLKATKEIGCHSSVTYESSVHVKECILFSDAGNVQATLYYSIDGGRWRMTGILLGGTPAFPGFAASTSSAKSAD